LEGFNLGENTSDFFWAENGGKASFSLGAEADAAIADAHGIGGPVVGVLAVEKIILKFLFAESHSSSLRFGTT
jgi:hypothetical protein